MADPRCGLHCIGCEWKESCGCGGCIETMGHPFHGDKLKGARVEVCRRWAAAGHLLRRIKETGLGCNVWWI